MKVQPLLVLAVGASVVTAAPAASTAACGGCDGHPHGHHHPDGHPNGHHPGGHDPGGVGPIVPWSWEQAGMGHSHGKIGWQALLIPGANGGLGTGLVGINQQSSQLGPAFFDLDIVKSALLNVIGAQASGGGGAGGAAGGSASLPLVDIGKWRGGIAGIGESDGKLGFVSNSVADGDGLTTGITGFNKQNNHIGPADVDFNLLAGANLAISPGGDDEDDSGDGGSRPVGPHVSMNAFGMDQFSNKLFGVGGPAGKLGWNTNFTADATGFGFGIGGINNDQTASGGLHFGLNGGAGGDGSGSGSGGDCDDDNDHDKDTDNKK